MDSGDVGLEKQSAEEQEETRNYSKVLQEMMKFRSKAVTLGTDRKGQVKRFFKWDFAVIFLDVGIKRGNS